MSNRRNSGTLSSFIARPNYPTILNSHPQSYAPPSANSYSGMPQNYLPPAQSNPAQNNPLQQINNNLQPADAELAQGGQPIIYNAPIPTKTFLFFKTWKTHTYSVLNNPDALSAAILDVSNIENDINDRIDFADSFPKSVTNYAALALTAIGAIQLALNRTASDNTGSNVYNTVLSVLTTSGASIFGIFTKMLNDSRQTALNMQKEAADALTQLTTSLRPS